MPVLFKLIFAAIALSIILPHFVKIVRDYEKVVIFRLGRALPQPKGPGIIFLFPLIDKAIKLSLRTVTLDVPPQDIITKDNVSVKVNAVVYYRVLDPNKAIIEVEEGIREAISKALNS